MSNETLDASAILFDMDGTIVDSIPRVEAFWFLFAERYGLDPTGMLDFAHGRQAAETIRHYLGPDVDPNEVIAALRAAPGVEGVPVTEIPGARRLFDQLADARVALVTSAGRDVAIQRVADAGLPMPAAAVFAEDIAVGKPAPDCFERGAELLGVPPGECIVFEDSEAGIRAGIASGAQVIVVGGHVSVTTAGLPRVPDLTPVSAAVHADGTIRLTIAT